MLGLFHVLFHLLRVSLRLGVTVTTLTALSTNNLLPAQTAPLTRSPTGTRGRASETSRYKHAHEEQTDVFGWIAAPFPAIFATGEVGGAPSSLSCSSASSLSWRNIFLLEMTGDLLGDPLGETLSVPLGTGSTPSVTRFKLLITCGSKQPLSDTCRRCRVHP